LPEDFEEQPVENRSYKGYWAGISIGLCIVILFAVAGSFGTLKHKKRLQDEDHASDVLQARKAGDVEVSGILSGVFNSRLSEHTNRLIQEYSKGLPDKNLSLRIAVAKRVFTKISDSTSLKSLKLSDRDEWSQILSKNSIPHFQVSTYLKTVDQENLGPLNLPTQALIYSKSGDQVKADLLMQQAKQEAVNRIGMYGVFIAVAFFIFIAGITFLVIGIESIQRLPQFAFSEEIPSSFVFPKYLLGYYIGPMLVFSGMSSYIGQALLFPIAMLFAQLVGLVMLAPAGIAARFRYAGKLRSHVGLAISGLTTTLPVHVVAMIISYTILHKPPENNSLAVYLSSSGIPCVLTVIAIVLVGPFLEELAFRGVLLDSLQEKLSFWPAAVISSMAFSALHLDFAFRFVPMFFFGLVMCYLRRRSGSLTTSFIAHVINNAIVTAFFFMI